MLKMLSSLFSALTSLFNVVNHLASAAEKSSAMLNLEASASLEKKLKGKEIDTVIANMQKQRQLLDALNKASDEDDAETSAS